MSKEDCSSLSAFLEGILIPSPPSRAGREKRSHLVSLGGGLPVRTGSKSILNTVSYKIYIFITEVWSGLCKLTTCQLLIHLTL